MPDRPDPLTHRARRAGAAVNERAPAPHAGGLARVVERGSRPPAGVRTVITLVALVLVIPGLGWLARVGDDGVRLMSPDEPAPAATAPERDIEEPSPAATAADAHLDDADGPSMADASPPPRPGPTVEGDPPEVPPFHVGEHVLGFGRHAAEVLDLVMARRHRVVVAQLQGSDAPYPAVRRGSVVAFYGTGGNTWAASAETLDAPRLVGRSTYFVPGADERAVWLVDGALSTAAANRVTKVTVDGDVLVEPTAVPDGWLVQAAVSTGVVLTRFDTETDEGELAIWDPRGDPSVPDAAVREATFLGAGAHHLVSCPRTHEEPLTGACSQAEILDVRTGDVVTASAPEERGWVATRGVTTSPDHRHIALTSPGQTEDAERLVVVRTDTGEVEATVDLPDGIGQVGQVAWTPDSGVVLAGGGAHLGVVSLRDDQTWVGEPGGHEWFSLVAIERADPVPPGPYAPSPLAVETGQGDVEVLASGHPGGPLRGVEAATGELRWERDGGDSPYLLGAPVGTGVYVVAPHGEVQARDAWTDEVRWRLELDPQESAQVTASTKDILVLPSTFPIMGDGRPPRVWGLEPGSGGVRWQAQGVAGTQWQWAPPLIVEREGARSLVVVVDTPSSPESPATTAHAFDLDSGEVVWRADLASMTQGYGTQAPTVVDDVLLVAVPGRGLVALEVASGQERWSLATEGPPHVVERQDAAVIVSADGDHIAVNLDSGDVVARGPIPD